MGTNSLFTTSYQNKHVTESKGESAYEMDLFKGDRDGPEPLKCSNLRASQEGLSFRQGALKASNGGLRASQRALGAS